MVLGRGDFTNEEWARLIKHALPEPKNHRARRKRRGSCGGQPTGTDKRAYLFHGSVTVASIRLRLRLRLRS